MYPLDIVVSGNLDIHQSFQMDIVAFGNWDMCQLFPMDILVVAGIRFSRNLDTFRMCPTDIFVGQALYSLDRRPLFLADTRHKLL